MDMWLCFESWSLGAKFLNIEWIVIQERKNVDPRFGSSAGHAVAVATMFQGDFDILSTNDCE